MERVSLLMDQESFPQELLLDPSNPLSIARLFLSLHYEQGGVRTLHYWQSVFYAYSGAYYRELGTQEIRVRVYEFLDGAVILDEKSEKREPFKPKKSKVDTVMDALKAAAYLSTDYMPPSWLHKGSNLPPSAEILVCNNGLLHLPTRRLYPATPEFFATHGLPFDFDGSHSCKPQRWLKFLGELWPNDPDCIDTLQEWFGYLLTQDTRQQKILLLIGPRRSGKGTIARIIRGLIGKTAYCGPTLAGLSSHFGLATLIGKSVAVIPDARLGTGTTVITERLLSVSGEDPLSIDRKYLSPWTGTLPTRLIILTNELPGIADTSGALAGRFMILPTRESFFGREDLELSNTLVKELPSILQWALTGLDRLRKRGHFVQPRAAEDMVQELAELGSPMSAFVRQECETGPGYSVKPDALFQGWKNWCESNGHTPGNVQSFGRDLHAVFPGLKVTQPRVDGKPVRMYQGIRLKKPSHRCSFSPSEAR